MRESQDFLVLGNTFSIIGQLPNGHPPGYATGIHISLEYITTDTVSFLSLLILFFYETRSKSC